MSDSNDKSYGRRHSRSLFGPIVLIALGAYFLLRNLGVAPDLNWGAVARLWPLLLVFIGLNIIVNQIPRPFGSFFSALVGLLAVAVFGYVLLYGVNNPLFSRWGVSVNEEIQRTEVEFPMRGLETADVEIEFGPAGAHVYALEDSRNLLEGSVTFLNDEPAFDTEITEDRAAVELSMGESFGWFLDPDNWATFGEADRWEIGLNPGVVMDLDLSLGTGAANLDLDELTLSSLQVMVGTGSVDLTLPGGNYDMTYQVGTGSTTLTLPQNGRQTIEIDGGTGSVLIYVPEEIEARVEVDQGLGSFSLDTERFEQVTGGEEEGVWETIGYGSAENQVNLIIQTGVGNISIRPLTEQ